MHKKEVEIHKLKDAVFPINPFRQDFKYNHEVWKKCAYKCPTTKHISEFHNQFDLIYPLLQRYCTIFGYDPYFGSEWTQFKRQVEEHVAINWILLNLIIDKQDATYMICLIFELT